jgi:hypothetical protein
MATIPIPFEVQTPGRLLDEGALALCSRFYVDIDTGGELVSVVICVDGNDYAYQKQISSVGRSTIELAYQVSGRVYSIRLTASLTFGQIEFFECWSDLDLGKQGQAVGQ